MSHSRFQDWNFQFNDISLLVACTRCKKCVRATISSKPFGKKVACKACGYSKIGNAELWLQTPCCGHTLDAKNEEELDFLEGWVSATLRERVPNDFWRKASRLPEWMVIAKNRDEVLRCINRLREKLKDCDC